MHIYIDDCMTWYYTPQMIMLYRDPKGENVGKFAPTVEVSGSNQLGTNQSNTNDEEKVTLLKTLKEKEDKINELSMEIQMLKVLNWREREINLFVCRGKSINRRKKMESQSMKWMAPMKLITDLLFSNRYHTAAY